MTRARWRHLGIERFILGFLIVSLFACPGPGSRAAEADTTSDWPAALLRTVSWRLPRFVSGADVDGLVYGNPEVGYFRLPQSTVEGRRITGRLFPPTYRVPVEFYVQTKKVVRPVRLGTKTFDSPFVQAGMQPKVKAVGVFSSPFFISDFFLNGRATTAIFNNLGEIVWMMTPIKLNLPPKIRWVADKISPTEILTSGILPEETGLFVHDMKTG